MLTEGDIRRIAGRIADAYRPLAVGIFGSYAIGRATDRSDLDLFIISRTRGALAVHPRAVRRLLFDVLHPLDVLVFTPVNSRTPCMNINPSPGSSHGRRASTTGIARRSKPSPRWRLEPPPVAMIWNRPRHRENRALTALGPTGTQQWPHGLTLPVLASRSADPACMIIHDR